jgi:hypothetical protein
MPRDLDIWAKLATALIAIAGVTSCPTGFWSDRRAGDIGGTSFGGILLRLDVYNFGMAWPEIAQFKAYSSGIPFVVEGLLPLAIGRPPAITAIIPTRDPPVGSGSKCNAVWHCTLLSQQKHAVALTLTNPGRHWTDWAKNVTGAKFGQPIRVGEIAD